MIITICCVNILVTMPFGTPGLHVIDVTNPFNPTFRGCYSGDGYVHDAQCVIYHGPDTRCFTIIVVVIIVVIDVIIIIVIVINIITSIIIVIIIIIIIVIIDIIIVIIIIVNIFTSLINLVVVVFIIMFSVSL